MKFLVKRKSNAFKYTVDLFDAPQSAGMLLLTNQWDCEISFYETLFADKRESFAQFILDYVFDFYGDATLQQSVRPDVVAYRKYILQLLGAYEQREGNI